MQQLIEKYNVAAPRYTSYPTVPYWDEIPPSEESWKRIVKKTFDSTNAADGITLYVHLPFCEKLCTYCGCNTRITINHLVELPYIKALLSEWKMYLDLFGDKPNIKEIHFGGGTPTFFSPQNLQYFVQELMKEAAFANDPELSFEGHPNNTTEEHLKSLYVLGFRRVSFGIQDFDPRVQTIINRVQSYDDVKRVTDQARAIGYTSINYDLIYGLPLQTAESVQKTIEQVVELHPDRIAFYSYAHVPWIKPGQRKYTEADLPDGETKRKLYEDGRNAFEKAGYVEIGMDHFALPNDPLHLADKSKTLNRNFMGYTTTQSKLLIGLGASSISDAWNGFVQNEKKVEDYYAKLKEGKLPFFKGHELNAEDLFVRQQILNIMCKHESSWTNEEDATGTMIGIEERLSEMIKDGLVELDSTAIKVTPAGKAFIRNICMAMDARLIRKQPQTVLFSKSI